MSGAKNKRELIGFSVWCVLTCFLLFLSVEKFGVYFTASICFLVLILSAGNRAFEKWIENGSPPSKGNNGGRAVFNSGCDKFEGWFYHATHHKDVPIEIDSKRLAWLAWRAVHMLNDLNRDDLYFYGDEPMPARGQYTRNIRPPKNPKDYQSLKKASEHSAPGDTLNYSDEHGYQLDGRERATAPSEE